MFRSPPAVGLGEAGAGDELALCRGGRRGGRLGGGGFAAADAPAPTVERVYGGGAGGGLGEALPLTVLLGGGGRLAVERPVVSAR